MTITSVNANVSPALYHATLTYSSGSTNPNAVLYITDIENLVQIGVPVVNNISNPTDIPSTDQIVFSSFSTAPNS